MTPEQKVAYILAQVASMNAELEAMKVANRERENQGYAPAYGENAFMELAASYGVTHNQVIAYFMN